MEVGGKLHAPAALPPGGKSPPPSPYRLDRSWVGPRVGRDSSVVFYLHILRLFACLVIRLIIHSGTVLCCCVCHQFRGWY